ncbi:calcium-activated chloride channel regulator 3A-1-like [Dendrobates tinctorius]|uniref:calcium-activated chloride channel regulator 3A-1-like n=1 Tax=Dendrobates tinctorius TaxID=92724 RepID=UPI003CC9C635
MALRNVLVSLLISLMFNTSGGSLVKVNDGGYEDIVFAINPEVKEDIRIIEEIQAMVKEATSYLFQATRKRLYIRSVKILIPSTWTPSDNYTKPGTETYDTADIIITNPYLKYGYDPYTLQYGRCGEPGRYIHLTPNFLLDDSLLSVYGPRDRVFVHEWAHLRWGVYDEYNEETPYYVAGNSKVEATRCSLDILGTNILKTSECHGENCPTKACNFDVATGLYEEGCMFVPYYAMQFSQDSIMYSQALLTVTDFCDVDTHNSEAPNLQNRMCNYRSTWDVIKDSTDISSCPPRPDFIFPVPSFTLLQHRDRVITLVLDVSGSMMLNDRMRRLHQAADIFLTQIVETSTYIGIVEFSKSASVISPLEKINDQQRERLKSLIPSSATDEGTNICSGIVTGLEVNKNLDGSAQGTEIVLLTDGEDNYDTRLCFPNITASGAVIHVIALGPYAEKELENIAAMTGGRQFAVLDNLDTNGVIDAFSRILPVDGHDLQQTIQLESTSLDLKPRACLNGTIFIDRTVGNDTSFMVTWQTAEPNIQLRDPKGILYTEAQFISDVTSKISRLQLPRTAERGGWDYRLCNPLTTNQVIGITVTSKAADENVPPIITNCHMNRNTNNYPNPMVIYASVSQGLLPVTGAKVTAMIESESGISVTTELLDNGAGVDLAANDGIYSRYFTSFTENGRYSLKVRVIGEDNKSRLMLPSSRVLYIPGYVNNDKVILNPPRPTISDDDLQVRFGAFSRTASGGSFVVSNVPSGVKPDIHKPEKISDLEARLVHFRTVLSWTATGDDLDQGQASKYELRMSSDPKRIRENFETSTLVNTASLIPQPAGFKENFIFASENMNIPNGTALYYAIVAIDKAGQKSDRSNIAQSVFYNVPPPSPTTSRTSPTTSRTSPTTSRTSPTTSWPSPTTSQPSPTTSQPSPSTSLPTRQELTTTKMLITSAFNMPSKEPNGKPSAIIITAIVCSAAIVICILVCIAVCFVTCKKN